MLRSQDLDVIAVQEVRFEASDHTHNQISDLTTVLPDYQVKQLRSTGFQWVEPACENETYAQSLPSKNVQSRSIISRIALKFNLQPAQVTLN